MREMNTKVFKFLIYISAFALIAVISGQVIWTLNTRNLVHQNTSALVELSVTKTADDFSRIINARELSGGDSVPQCSHQLPYSAEALGSLFDSLLLVENTLAGISAPFVFALVQHDSVVFLSDTAFGNFDWRKAPFSKNLYCGRTHDGMMLFLDFPEGYRVNNPFSHFSVWWFISMLGFVIIIAAGFVLIRSFSLMKRDSLRRINIINNLAHEFKTPIASVNLGAEMLLNDQIRHDPDRVTKYGELIRFEIRRLQHNVDQILNVVLLEEGQLMLRFQYISLNELVSEMVEKYMAVRTDLQNRIMLDLHATDDVIYADRAHVLNVISNLIENAVKYGGDDVVISISTGNRGSQRILIVSDNGPGIPRKYQKLVFERYFRINPGNRHDIKGHGIGLYYVKSILRKMNADISLSTSQSRGARFEIVFPEETITH